LAKVSDDDDENDSKYNSSSSGSLSSKSSSKKKKIKEKKKKGAKPLSSTNDEEAMMNERQPLLSKNSEEEKEKEEEEKRMKSGTGFAKTCKAIGAFSALTMTASVCFVGYQVYPVVSDDLSLGNIAQHLQSYLLVDLPNGNLKPVLPDESDLLPIDADGNFILPGGKNQTASSATLPATSAKKKKGASSSLEPSEEVAGDTHPDIMNEAVIGEKEDEEDADADGKEEQVEKKSTFGGFLKSKAKEDEATATSTSDDASDDAEEEEKEDIDEEADDDQEEQEEEEKDDQTDEESEGSEEDQLKQEQEDSSANYSGKELEKGSISSGYARSKERYAEAVKNFKSGKMSTSGKMYDLGPSETPEDVEEEEEEEEEGGEEKKEEKVNDEEGTRSSEEDPKSSVIPKVKAVAKIVDKTKDSIFSALETIDHLEKGTEEAPDEKEEEKEEEEKEEAPEEESRANPDDMPSLEGISTTSAEKRMNEDTANAKASAEARNLAATASAATSADGAIDTSGAAVETTSTPKILVSKACETSEDETALGLYRQVNSKCESTEDGIKVIGCIPKTKNCQGCYLSDTPAASQKDSLTQCASVVCDFHDVQGCQA
jgi:hypothetical protein